MPGENKDRDPDEIPGGQDSPSPRVRVKTKRLDRGLLHRPEERRAESHFWVDVAGAEACAFPPRLERGKHDRRISKVGSIG
jgi:hypothetical protein